MKINIFLLALITVISAGCVKDQTLVNSVIGEYSGHYTKNNKNQSDYLLDVSGDVDELTIKSSEDSEFPVLKFTPIVKNSTEISYTTGKEDKIKYSIAFIFRGEKIVLSLVLFDTIKNDSLFYGGFK